MKIASVCHLYCSFCTAPGCCVEHNQMSFMKSSCQQRIEGEPCGLSLHNRKRQKAAEACSGANELQADAWWFPASIPLLWATDCWHFWVGVRCCPATKPHSSSYICAGNRVLGRTVGRESVGEMVVLTQHLSSSVTSDPDKVISRPLLTLQ